MLSVCPPLLATLIRDVRRRRATPSRLRKSDRMRGEKGFSGGVIPNLHSCKWRSSFITDTVAPPPRKPVPAGSHREVSSMADNSRENARRRWWRGFFCHGELSWFNWGFKLISAAVIRRTEIARRVEGRRRFAALDAASFLGLGSGMGAGFERIPRRYNGYTRSAAKPARSANSLRQERHGPGAESLRSRDTIVRWQKPRVM